jgi:epoxyqueuosine reductase
LAARTRHSSAVFRTLAQELGFELSGVAPAAPLEEYRYYNQWITDGMAGRMGYLADRRGALRADPRLLLGNARSVLCVGMLYNTHRDKSLADDQGYISRYAWGADYHEVLNSRLEALVERLHTEWGDFDSKICVDTAPLLERALARRAGLGWLGRNTCLINEATGSWYFLGEVLVSVDVEPDAPPPDRCGTCMRCVEACPTQALVPSGFAGGPDHALDSRCCISYFTIELKHAPPEEMRQGIGAHVFGCDICQDVCPWNNGAAVTEKAVFQPLNAVPRLEQLAGMDAQEFQKSFKNTPIWRAKHRKMLQNAAIAMGNRGLLKFRPALEKLARHDDPTVAEAARWALGRLGLK